MANSGVLDRAGALPFLPDPTLPAHDPASQTYLLELPANSRAFDLALKRLLDVVIAFLALMALAPGMLLLAALVYVTSPGPVLYRSRRIGLNGEPFDMLKFRTMVPDADKLWEALRKQANLEGRLFKLENDPRLTPIGGFLRKYSLDELPQLINVLLGDMSLVGPRPFVPAESAMFDPPYTLRFSVMPGVTGPWQANGRSNTPFEELCELELRYVTQWSLWEDCRLLLKTVPAVLLKRGAY